MHFPEKKNCLKIVINDYNKHYFYNFNILLIIQINNKKNY